MSAFSRYRFRRRVRRAMLGARLAQAERTISYRRITARGGRNLSLAAWPLSRQNIESCAADGSVTHFGLGAWWPCRISIRRLRRQVAELSRLAGEPGGKARSVYRRALEGCRDA